MASPFTVSISAQSVAEVEKTFMPSTTEGADLRFHGVVRDTEGDAPITGIDYSCYEAMALPELEKIAREMTESEEAHRVEIHHVTGFVPIGVASIVIRVQTKHSAAAFELCREYLRRIKERVPIWKKIETGL